MEYKMRSDKTVLAYQMTEKSWGNPSVWPSWLYSRFYVYPRNDSTPKTFLFGRSFPIISSIDGDHKLDFGDYIVQGLNGELYRSKKDVFESLYEAVT